MFLPFVPPPAVVSLQAAGQTPPLAFAPPPKATASSAPPAAQAVKAAAAPAAAGAAPDASLTVPMPAAVPAPAGISPMALLKTTLAATSPLAVSEPAAPHPAQGLWVLATARCPLPLGSDLNAWAECTQPLGFKDGGELAVLEKPRNGNKAQTTGGLFSIARTRFRVRSLPAAAPAVPGLPGPVLVQVDVPGLTGRSYVFIAAKPDITDADGRFVSARVWPVACPPPATPDVLRKGDRCVASTLKAVIDAAQAQPADGGYVLRWIDPTDAGSAGDTGGGRRYADAPAPVFKAPKRLSPLEAAEPLPISDLPPELAAQQPQTPAYAPRDEGDDAPSAAKLAASAKAALAKPAAAAGAKAKARAK